MTAGTSPVKPPVGPIDPLSRILIIRPSALGDVCRSVGLLAALRRSLPEARIDWLVQDSFVAAIDEHPAFDSAPRGGKEAKGGGEVIPFARHTMKRWYAPQGAGALARLIGRLRSARYDIVIDAQGLLRSSIFTWLSGAAVRVGLAEAREGATSFYTHLVLMPSHQSSRHTVDRMHDLLHALAITPCRDLRLYASEHRKAEVLSKIGLPASAAHSLGFITFAPSSRWPSKQWPAERYAIVASALHERFGLPIVCVGSQAERAGCEPLFAGLASQPWLIDAFGKTSVADLMGLIAQSRLVIGSDSAAVHMAVGFAVPCVALYGPTDIAKVGPAKWPGAEGRVITLQHRHAGDTLDHKSLEPGQTMMARIDADEVIAAAAALLRPR